MLRKRQTERGGRSTWPSQKHFYLLAQDEIDRVDPPAAARVIQPAKTPIVASSVRVLTVIRAIGMSNPEPLLPPCLHCDGSMKYIRTIGHLDDLPGRAIRWHEFHHSIGGATAWPLKARDRSMPANGFLSSRAAADPALPG